MFRPLNSCKRGKCGWIWWPWFK